MVVAITKQEMAFASVGLGGQRAAKHGKPENYRDFHVLGKIISLDSRKYQIFENLRYCIFSLTHSESIPVFGSTVLRKLTP